MLVIIGDASRAIDEILAQGMIPVIVGGTGFYIHSILYDMDFSWLNQMKSFAIICINLHK